MAGGLLRDSLSLFRHSRANGNPENPTFWTPAFAGVTREVEVALAIRYRPLAIGSSFHHVDRQRKLGTAVR